MGRTRTWDVEEAFDWITKGDDTGTRWSVRRFAQKADVSASAVSKALIEKFGPDWQGPAARNYGSLPWYLPAPYHNSTEANRCRFLLRREAGETLPPEDEGRLNNFLAQFEPGWVLAFDVQGRRGSGAWLYRRRFAWEVDGVHILHGIMAKEAWPEEPC